MWLFSEMCRLDDVSESLHLMGRVGGCLAVGAITPHAQRNKLANGHHMFVTPVSFFFLFVYSLLACDLWRVTPVSVASQW